MAALLAVPTPSDRHRYWPLRTRRMADSLRLLALDTVERARSDHPGAPSGTAEMAVALWDRHLKHNPANPRWPDRDRFVPASGHSSALLVSLMHLTGYDLPISELQNFRQGGSRTPAHPEVGTTRGFEAAAGPLGQGLADAVGIALAEKLLADEFNREGHTIVDHRTWVFLDDGCLTDGLSQEACSLAAAWKLNKLVALCDDNGISIDGGVGPRLPDAPARFRACGWNVIGPVDGHDVDALDAALRRAADCGDRPSLIVCRTQTGMGSPNRAGGAKAIGWPYASFEIPKDVYAAWNARERGEAACRDWQGRFSAYQAEFPALAAEFGRRMRGDLPADFHETLVSLMVRFGRSQDSVATDEASEKTLAALASKVPELIGARRAGHGLREFGVAAAMNGMALHGGCIPYGGTSLTFSEDSRNAIRSSALMKQRVVHVVTHDSIGLGEDAAARQAVDHAASLQRIPNLDVWRPCDAAETAVAWLAAISQARRPSALLLSKQELPAQGRSPEQVLAIRRGGYVLSDRADAAAVLLASGSEVPLATEAQQMLDAGGVPVRVVSMPSIAVFDRQNSAWRDDVLPAGLPRFGVEAGMTPEALSELVRKHVGTLRPRSRVEG